MTYNPRLSRVERAIRRANAQTNPDRGNMIATRNLIRNTETLPLGFPAYNVMSNRSH